MLLTLITSAFPIPDLVTEPKPEAYLEPSQTSKMELFAKIVNDF